MEVKVPDIGDFTDVPVINILVSVGDEVSEEDPLIELESDKATMEVPSPASGKVASIAVKEGDKVSEGSVILVLEGADAGAGDAAPSGGGEAAPSGGGGGGGTVEVKVPDIGDFSDVPVIGIMVSVGDTVAEEDPLIELESDKATMEVPSPAAGKIVSIAVSEGDKVSEGSLILTLEGEGGGAAAAPAKSAAPAARHRRRWPPPAARPARAISTARSWCLARVPAATRQPSGPPISARRWC